MQEPVLSSLSTRRRYKRNAKCGNAGITLGHATRAMQCRDRTLYGTVLEVYVLHSHHRITFRESNIESWNNFSTNSLFSTVWGKSWVSSLYGPVVQNEFVVAIQTWMHVRTCCRILQIYGGWNIQRDQWNWHPGSSIIGLVFSICQPLVISPLHLILKASRSYNYFCPICLPSSWRPCPLPFFFPHSLHKHLVCSHAVVNSRSNDAFSTHGSITHIFDHGRLWRLVHNASLTTSHFFFRHSMHQMLRTSSPSISTWVPRFSFWWLWNKMGYE